MKAGGCARASCLLWNSSPTRSETLLHLELGNRGGLFSCRIQHFRGFSPPPPQTLCAHTRSSHAVESYWVGEEASSWRARVVLLYFLHNFDQRSDVRGVAQQPVLSLGMEAAPAVAALRVSGADVSRPSRVLTHDTNSQLRSGLSRRDRSPARVSVWG